jgi:uncharacterized membrane protein
MNTEPPKSDRLAAFSDGVIAVIITIMVLDLKAPHGVSWRSLVPLWPTFLAYTLSYLFVGVFWSNHHYLLRKPNEPITNSWARTCSHCLPSL